MIHIKGLQLDVELGSFHGVTAVGLGEDCVSVLDKFGNESLLLVRPVFNQRTADFEPIETIGMFGDINMAVNGYAIPGIDLREITGVSCTDEDDDDPRWDFHRRTLRLHTASGITLAWKLFCEGKRP